MKTVCIDMYEYYELSESARKVAIQDHKKFMIEVCNKNPENDEAVLKDILDHTYYFFVQGYISMMHNIQKRN